MHNTTHKLCTKKQQQKTPFHAKLRSQVCTVCGPTRFIYNALEEQLGGREHERPDDELPPPPPAANFDPRPDERPPLPLAENVDPRPDLGDYLKPGYRQECKNWAKREKSRKKKAAAAAAADTTADVGEAPLPKKVERDGRAHGTTPTKKKPRNPPL